MRDGQRAGATRTPTSGRLPRIQNTSADGGPTALDIEATVTSRIQGGSIVLLHLGGWNTREALPGIVEALEAKNLVPVTLSELLVP